MGNGDVLGTIVDLQRELNAALADNASKTRALASLTRWGEWQRKRRAPTMDEPESGALGAAQELLDDPVPGAPLLKELADLRASLAALDDLRTKEKEELRAKLATVERDAEAMAAEIEGWLNAHNPQADYRTSVLTKALAAYRASHPEGEET